MPIIGLSQVGGSSAPEAAWTPLPSYDIFPPCHFFHKFPHFEPQVLSFHLNQEHFQPFFAIQAGDVRAPLRTGRVIVR